MTTDDGKITNKSKSLEQLCGCLAIAIVDNNKSNRHCYTTYFAR